jgi:hypothetical protein
MVGGKSAYRRPPNWTVDVQDVGKTAVQAVWGQGMLADGPTSRVAA